ncbi:ATP-binding cassette domain-containing protein [Dactylosporangium sp. AC04546]|uniref:ABC transporter ATP-binding protein n=1 Tax=Dactylosporangium sp. AC04546 TaxID=2862460 RepID=UPI001EDE1162|nr:ATP-binding cassette domain-containing protein [Dactylosporangium sp. AC04546]WVK80904.1 ATP-binding cassette domain-containing protein [Dactylosporangium sp. AC04546]
MLELDGVSLAFGGIKAVNDVTMHISEGMCFGLIGPNGAGKTALLNCISGVYRPAGGEIRFQGRQLNGLAPDVISALGIGRTFQSMEQFEQFLVIDYLLISRTRELSRSSTLAALRWPPVIRRERAERHRAMETLEALGLETHAQHRLSEVPYGTQKLIDIARVLCSDATFVLLDEPTSGTTSSERPGISKALDFLLGGERTVVVVDHDVDFVTRHADRVAALDQGRLIAEGTSREVMADPVVRRIYLGLVHDA